MIKVIKLDGDINLQLTNYKWDSSKNMINKKADQLSAERIQSLLRVRIPLFIRSIMFSQGCGKEEMNAESPVMDS